MRILTILIVTLFAVVLLIDYAHFRALMIDIEKSLKICKMVVGTIKMEIKRRQTDGKYRRTIPSILMISVSFAHSDVASHLTLSICVYEHTYYKTIVCSRIFC